MEIRLLRHATLIVQYAGLTFLVDPMLSHAGAMEPVRNAVDYRRIPLVELPIDDSELENLLTRVNTLIVTHSHRDHWDVRAAALIRKDMSLIGQPEDMDYFQNQGFTALHPVTTELEWRGVTLHRTGGQHGTGDIGQKMGKVSGFVLKAQGEPTLYLAGDTIWCPEVESALGEYRPDITILNTGAAQFLVGGPITMNAEDVIRVARTRPEMDIVAVHMETINHCLLTRADLAAAIKDAGVADRVRIPSDGEVMSWRTR